MKRILVLLMVCALVLWAVPVWAAEEPAFVVETVTAQPGDTVDVVIRLQNNPGIVSAKLMVSYDEGLTLTSVAYGDALGGMTMDPLSLSSPVTLNWISAFAEMTEDAVYATLTFTVVEDASAGTYGVCVTYDENDVYNIAEENVYFAVENGGITVTGAQSGPAQTEPSISDPTASAQSDTTNPDHGDGILWGALALSAAALAGVLLLRKRK